MTLLSKFLTIKCYSTRPVDLSTSQAIECVKVADDNAIEFGKWMNNQVMDPKGTHYHLHNRRFVSELYLIFKQVKGL